MSLVIRPAVPADADAIAALHADSRRELFRGVLADSYLDGAMDDELRGRWQDAVAAPGPGWTILVAILDAAFAGFVSAGPYPDEPERQTIQNVYVAPGPVHAWTGGQRVDFVGNLL